MIKQSPRWYTHLLIKFPAGLGSQVTILRKIRGNSLESFPGISENSQESFSGNPVKMLTEIGDFLENFRGMILHSEIPGMNTVQWQGFGLGWRFSYENFPGIYKNQF